MSKIFTRSTFAVLPCFTLSLLSLLMAQTVWAQDIRGVVRDELRAPIPGVHVAIPALEIGSITDTEGRYVLSGLSAGAYELTFSFVGFQTLTKQVQLADEDVVLNASLRAEILEAEEVLVEEDRADALTRDSRSISELDAEQLADLRGQTLGETLESLPGVSTMQTGPSISKPVVRGLHSQRVLVLNAGVSQEGQQWGGEHAPEIDPFSPVKVQVIKGVSGVEYGVGAIGGVIKLDPLELPYMPGDGLSGQLSLNGFSNNMQGAGSIYLESPVDAIPGVGWRVQGSYRKAGDAHTPGYVIHNSAFEEFNGSVSVGLQRDRVNFVTMYSRFSTELGIYSGAHIGNLNDLLRAIALEQPAFIGEFGYDIAPPKQTIAHNLVSVHGDYRLESGSWIEAQYGLQLNHRQEFDAHGAGEDSLSTEAAFDLSLVSNTLELKYHHRPIGNLIGVVGINGMMQVNQNDAVGFLIPNFRAYSGGVFARESWVKDNLTLEAGARLDYRWVRAWPREFGNRGEFVKRISDYASLSGVVGGIWQFAPTWSIGVNLGSGWRPPGVNELYNFGVHHGTAQFESGNPDLGNERSIGLDGTLRHNTERTRAEISGYRNRFYGFIFLFPDAEPRVTIRGTFPSFTYSQADAVLQGFDAAVEHDFASWLTLSGQVSVVRADNMDTDEPLINMPSDKASVEAQFNLPAGEKIHDAHFKLEGVFVRKQTRVPQEADYAAPPDGYSLLNAGFSATFAVPRTHVRFNMELHNVFNTAYRDYLSRFRYFIDDPGRSLILRIQVPIGQDA